MGRLSGPCCCVSQDPTIVIRQTYTVNGTNKTLAKESVTGNQNGYITATTTISPNSFYECVSINNQQSGPECPLLYPYHCFDGNRYILECEFKRLEGMQCINEVNLSIIYM